MEGEDETSFLQKGLAVQISEFQFRFTNTSQYYHAAASPSLPNWTGRAVSNLSPLAGRASTNEATPAASCIG